MSSPALGLPAPANKPAEPSYATLSGVATWRMAAAVMAIVFVSQLLITSRLNANDDLEMINRYFDSDNAWYLINFETGDQKFGSYGGRNVVHPNVANVIHPLVVAAGAIAGLFENRPAAELRKNISLAVSPMFAGIRSGLLFAALAAAGFEWFDGLLATALCSVAFSSVLFGCLPESFVISSAGFALYFLLAARGKLNPTPWIVSGAILSSVTVTNLAPFALGLFFLLHRQSKKFFHAARKTVVISSVSLVVTILCFLALTAAHGTFKGIGRKVGQLEEVGLNPRSLLIDFPRVVALSLVPVRPNQLIGVDEERKSTKVQIVRFTYRDDLDRIRQYVTTITGYQRFVNGSAQQIATLIAIALALLLSSQVQGRVRILFLLSLIQLAFHWTLHSFFGLDLMLYSQHWIVPLVIAICCGLRHPGSYRWPARAIVVSLLLAAAWQTAAVMKVLVS